MLSDVSTLIYGRKCPPPGGISTITLTGLMLNVLKTKPLRRKGEGVSLSELKDEFLLRIERLFSHQPALLSVLKKYIEKIVELDESITYFVLIAVRLLSDEHMYNSSCAYAVKQSLVRMPFPSEDDELQSVYKLPFLTSDRLHALPFDISPVLNKLLWQIEELEPEPLPSSNPWEENGRLSDHFRKLIFDDSLRALDQNILNNSKVNIEMLSFTKEEVLKSLMFLYSGISSELFNLRDGVSSLVLPEYVEVRDECGFGIKLTRSILTMHLELGNRLMAANKKLTSLSCVGCKDVLKRAVIEEISIFSSFLENEIVEMGDFYEKLTRMTYYPSNFLGFIEVCERLLDGNLVATEISTFLQYNLATSLDFIKDIASRVLKQVNIHIVKTLYLFSERGIAVFEDGVIENASEVDSVSVSSGESLYIKPTSLVSGNMCSNILWYGAIIREIAHDNNLQNPELHELQKNVRDPNTFVGKAIKEFMQEHGEHILDLTYIFNVFTRKNSQSMLISYMRSEVKIAANIMYKLFLHRCQVSERKSFSSKQYFCPDLPPEYQSAISAGGPNGGRLAVTLSKIVSVVITEKHQHGYEIIGEGLQKIFGGFDAITHLSTRNHYLLPGEDRRAFYYKHVMDRVLSNLISHTYQTVSPLWETFNEELDNADTVTSMIDSHRRFIREVRTNTIFHIVFTNKAFSFVTKMCESCILFANAFNLGDSVSLESHYKEFRANLDLLLDVLETGDFKFQPLCGMLGRFIVSKSRNFIRM